MKYSGVVSNRLIFSFLFIVLCGRAYAQAAEGASFATQIAIDSLKSDVYYLASDELRGRKAGSHGSVLAASYIAQKFKSYGLLPMNESYFQHFHFVDAEMYKEKFWIGKSLSVNNKRFDSGFFIPRHATRQKTLNIDKVLFVPNNFSAVGRGLFEVKGNAVVLFPGLTTADDSNFAALIASYYQAIDAGAKAVLIPSLHFTQKPATGEDMDFWELYKRIPEKKRIIPLITISWQVVECLVGAHETGPLPDDVKNENLGRYVFPKARLKLTWREIGLAKKTENVTGFIPGLRPFNMLIIGTHFDHAGSANGDIFYGADDNASGVAALLEMARAFGNAYQAGIVPERSIVFVAFNAEEAGKLGSKAFVQTILNKDSAFAMINMDMIGRNEFKRSRHDKVYVLGHDVPHGNWGDLLEKVQQTFPDLKLDFRFNRHNDKDHLLMRSDQYPFLSEQIPSLFFFDNMKEDYHKPTDKAEKIDFPLLQKRTKFIFLTAWELAYHENAGFRKYK